MAKNYVIRIIICTVVRLNILSIFCLSTKLLFKAQPSKDTHTQCNILEQQAVCSVQTFTHPDFILRNLALHTLIEFVELTHCYVPLSFG